MTANSSPTSNACTTPHKLIPLGIADFAPNLLTGIWFFFGFPEQYFDNPFVSIAARLCRDLSASGITFDDPTPDVVRELKISAPEGCVVIRQGRSEIVRRPRRPETR